MRQQEAQTLGRVIYQARKTQGLSLRAVEERTGIPRSWLSGIERGYYHRPAPDRLATLADLLHIPIRQIERLDAPLAPRVIDWRIALTLQERMTTEQTRKTEDFVRRLKRQHASADRTKAN